MVMNRKPATALIALTILLGMSFPSPGADDNAAPTGEIKLPENTNLPARLAEVQAKLQQGRPKKAYQLVKNWIKKNKDSEFMDQALFFKGQALFDRKLYYQAFEAYDELLDGYSGSSLFEAAIEQQVKIALKFLAGAKRKVWRFIPASAKTEGLEILEQVVERWPGSELAARALMMQADYYYNKGQFIEAQSTYQLLVENYRKSSYYEQALIRNAEATHARYEGPLYDSVPLTDARIRYEQYQMLYPEKAYQLGIPQRIERINWQEAQKYYKIADYYRRTHKDEALRFYVAYIRQRWADGEWTQRAQTLLKHQK